MTEAKKIKTLLGFAQKAGKLASGDFAVKAAFNEGRVKLLFLARDTASNSREEFLRLAAQAGVQVLEILSADELGVAIGKDYRVSVALLDENFLRILAVKHKDGGLKNAKTCVRSCERIG